MFDLAALGSHRCPRDGCDQPAMHPTSSQIRASGGYLWQCAAGHHGPGFIAEPGEE